MAVATNLKIDKEDFEKKIIEMQVALDGLTAAELDFIDGAVAGTGAASKAVVLDSGEDFIWPATGQLTYGGTAITADGAELNIMEGVTATTAEVNMAADESANTEVVTTTNVLTAVESGTTYILNATAPFVTTLPEVAAGLRFKFYCGALQPTAGDHTVIVHANDQATLFGQAVVAGVVILSTVDDTIIFEEDTTLPGDWVDVFCDGTNWYVSGMGQVALSIAFAT